MPILPKIPTSGDDLLTGPFNKLWRLKILLDRKTSNKIQSEPDTDLPNPKWKNTSITNSRLETLRENIPRIVGEKVNQGKPLRKPLTSTISNQIIIINPNTSPPTNLVIQGKPFNVEVEPETTWSTVKSAGRNNPFYIYTGGEDTIRFDISWYSTSKDRTDVIDKCRLLEAWSKGDGYTKSPPKLYISWGNSELFKDETFILWSAKYIIKNFQNSCNYGTRDNPDIVDLGLLPNLATQTLVFKRVTEKNTSHKDIMKPSNTFIKP